MNRREIYRWFGLFGGVFASLAVPTGILLPLVPPETTLSIYYFILLIVCCSSLLLSIIAKFYFFPSNNFSKVNVIRSYKNLSMIITEKAEWLGNNIAVSIFYYDDHAEIFIGSGFVSNIQQDGKTQITLTHFRPESERIIESVFKNETKILKSLIIKPGYGANYYETNQSG